MPEPGDHSGSGGCWRTWIGRDGLNHRCRAARHAAACRCPCGHVYDETEEVQVKRWPVIEGVTAEMLLDAERQAALATKTPLPTWADIERAALNCVVLHRAVKAVHQGLTREQALITVALSLSQFRADVIEQETMKLRLTLPVTRTGDDSSGQT